MWYVKKVSAKERPIIVDAKESKEEAETLAWNLTRGASDDLQRNFVQYYATDKREEENEGTLKIIPIYIWYSKNPPCGKSILARNLNDKVIVLDEFSFYGSHRSELDKAIIETRKCEQTYDDMHCIVIITNNEEVVDSVQAYVHNLNKYSGWKRHAQCMVNVCNFERSEVASPYYKLSEE